MIRINLLAPHAEGPGQWYRCLVIPPEQRAALAGLGLLVMTAIVVVTWWWSVVGERQALAVAFASAEADIARLRPAGDRVGRATDRVRALEARLALLARLRAAQQSPAALLEVVGRSLTEGLWLTELIQDEGGVELRGRALSFGPLADFIDRLHASGYFGASIEIVETGTETVAGTPLVRFLVRGTVGVPPDTREGELVGQSASRKAGGG